MCLSQVRACLAYMHSSTFLCLERNIETDKIRKCINDLMLKLERVEKLSQDTLKFLEAGDNGLTIQHG